jgi:ferredoxin--NADP+ reductase
MGRITHLIEKNKLTRDIGLPDLDQKNDRVMICGSNEFLKDVKKMLEARQFKEGNTTIPGDFVIEKAFAEQ